MPSQNLKFVPEEDFCIGSLGKQISTLSSQVSAYLEKISFAEPSFEADAGEVPEAPEYEALRASLNDAALDLLFLVNGPKTVLRDMLFSHYDLAALQVAMDRGFFHHVPLPSGSGDGHGVEHGAGISIAEIASKSGMDEDRASALLKLLASRRIFEQVEQGESGLEHFKHTAISASLARDAEWHALADMKLDDMFKASSELSTLISHSPYASSATASAFQQRFGMPVYQYYDQYPDKGKRFAHAMSSWSKVNERGTELRDSFSWESLGNGKVVDVGGGSGHISAGLAREFPSLRFVVQDKSPIQLCHDPEGLDGRVTFQQHDFFRPQPVHDASAFFLRQVLHNYNDEDSIKILRALVPALEECGRETPLLINDVVLPESGTVTRFEEHLLRQVDVSMMVLLGAKQRSQGDWARLLKNADPRFEVVKVQRNPLGVGLLQIHLQC